MQGCCCSARASADVAVGRGCAGSGRAATLSSQTRGEGRCSGSASPRHPHRAWSSPPPAGSVAHLHPTVHPVAKAPCLPVWCWGGQGSHGRARQLQGGWRWGTPTLLPKAGGPWLRAGSSALPPAPAPNTSSKRARQLHERPAAPAGCWLFFRPAIKLVNTWTRLTKHSSRRKWGVCRNTPLHIVMADINSMLITLCTFQSHILNPFR